MRSPRALLLYEDSNNCDLLRSLLCGEGCEVHEAPLNMQTALPTEGYCLVVFDIQRPSALLLESARAWRDAASDTTVVVVGTRTAQANRISVLESGVDAYVVKPLVIPELRARVRAALRRFRSQDRRARRLEIGNGIIDLEARLITGAGQRTHLTPTECGILEHLAAHLNQTVPRNELVKMLWGSDPQKGVHSLRLFIRRLRQKLEPDPTRPQYLVTEPAIGYRLQIPREDPGQAAHSPVP